MRIVDLSSKYTIYNEPKIVYNYKTRLYYQLWKL